MLLTTQLPSYDSDFMLTLVKYPESYTRDQICELSNIIDYRRGSGLQVIMGHIKKSVSYNVQPTSNQERSKRIKQI